VVCDPCIAGIAARVLEDVLREQVNKRGLH
jgi:hypothetical protein